MTTDAEKALRFERAIASMLTTPTLVAAAEQLEVHVTTLGDWRRDPLFASMLSDKRRELAADLAARLAQSAVRARAVLDEVMEDEDATNAEKIAAARIVLDRASSIADGAEVQERIDELRGLIAGRVGA